MRYERELHGYKVFLFGSRATGTNKERSDFDIGILGDEPISLKTFYMIGDFIDELPTLYKFDWVDMNRAALALRENALKHMEVLYG